MRSKGTAAELEARRRLAVRKVNDGWAQRAAAEFLGVHPVTVAKWMARFRAGGEDGGRAATPTPGRPRFLTPAQEAEVLGWLAEKPTAHGFRTDLWTARRVAHLIRERFGVAFHPHYLREWLSKRGYTPQKPARRAKQRNPEAVAGWLKADWPRIQKKRRRTTPTSS
jgi:transposase